MELFLPHRRALSRLPLSRRPQNQYWIVYSVDDASRTVNILRFWNASRDPDQFQL